MYAIRSYYVLDAVSVTSRYNNDQLQLNAHLVNNQLLDAIVESRIDIGDTLIIALPRLEVRTKQGHYYLPDTTQSVQLVNNSIQLNKLQLKDYLAPNFSLDAQGDFTFQQADNFKFAVVITSYSIHYTKLYEHYLLSPSMPTIDH